MTFRSIRWQLSLSYAAIAFLATLCLGIILLTVLDEYYSTLEQRNLQDRADSFSMLIADVLQDDTSLDVLNNQVRSLSFLSDARVIVRDPTGEMIADSGTPSETYLELSDYAFTSSSDNSNTSAMDWTTITLARPLEDGSFIVEDYNFENTSAFILNPGDTGSVSILANSPQNNTRTSTTEDEPRIVPVNYTPFFGFQVNDDNIEQMQQMTNGRSDQHATAMIYDIDANSLLGRLEISEGPAIGDNIIDSVANAWMLAGAIAIVSAASAGWLMSQRISKPLLALTETTSSMTTGDLSARANINRRDEIGTLSQSFNEMATRIENTVVTLRRFVADAAHELHTPLTALRTNLELNQENFGDENNIRALKQLKRIEALADDLLALSRIEAVTETKPFSKIDLVALINDISITYASWAEQADVDYLLDLPERAPQISGNPEQLRRMFSNILDNAIKFTPDNGTVTVKMTEEANNDYLKITVEDTGIGIPEDDLPHLFDRFRRGRNTNHHSGSGLGLAIVKAIIETHKGTVRAENHYHGSRITIVLPIENHTLSYQTTAKKQTVTVGYEQAIQH